jgi:hypothetical protein
MAVLVLLAAAISVCLGQSTYHFGLQGLLNWTCFERNTERIINQSIEIYQKRLPSYIAAHVHQASLALQHVAVLALPATRSSTRATTPISSLRMVCVCVFVWFISFSVFLCKWHSLNYCHTYMHAYKLIMVTCRYQLHGGHGAMVGAQPALRCHWCWRSELWSVSIC